MVENERQLMDELSKFKDYSNFSEYVEDVVLCLKTFCRYSEKEARDFIKYERKMVHRMYDAKYPAYNLAMDYYPICG